MKKRFLFIPALCFVLSGALAAKSIRSNVKSIRSDYFTNAKGKAQQFIISIIQ